MKMMLKLGLRHRLTISAILLCYYLIIINKLEIIMIRIIAALSIAMLCSTTNAAPNDSGCRSFMTTAEIIMSSRQSGVSLSDSLMILDRNFTNPESTAKREAVKQIVIAAYQEPYYHTESMKKVAVDEFAVLHYMACLEVNKK